MKLWLVCFLILFFGAETARWLGQLPWVGSTELSLPLAVVGGIGLAVASNYRHWPSLGAIAEKAASAPPLTTPPPASPTVAPSPQPPRSGRRADTISFEIKKPQGKKDEGR